MNTNLILVADSGSTKTDWSIASAGKICFRHTTAGTNPFFQSEEAIAETIGTELFPLIAMQPIETIFFYGAGCAFEEQRTMITRILQRFFSVPVEVASDLLGAARALCLNRPGIACILGTGSNSCQYDGLQIAKQVPALGFILGDEGSGATLGKLLVGDALKNQMPESLKRAFFEKYQLSQDTILNRVYRQPFPNRFLAGLSPFLLDNLSEPYCYDLLCRAFESFFRRNVMQYDYSSLPVHFLGSVAWYYKEPLQDVARKLKIETGTIVQSPMDGLIQFHTLSDY